MPLSARLRRGARWAAGAAAFALVVILAAHHGHGREMLRLVRSVKPRFLIIAAALQAATYACSAGIWTRVLRRAGSPQPFARLFRLAIARVFVTQAIPSGGISGDALLVSALARRGAPLEASMTALVLDLFGFYAAFAVCAVVTAALLGAYGVVSRGIVALVLPFSLILVAIPSLIIWLVRAGPAARETRLGRIPFLGRLLDAFGQARLDLARKPALLFHATAMQAATFVLDAGTLLAMLAALEPDPPSAASAFAGFTLAAAAELVGPVPGGLGAFEGGCIAGLHAFGVPIERALLATLLVRGFTFWLPMVPGMVIAREAVAAPGADRAHPPDD